MRWGAIKTGELLNSKKKEWELLKLLKCIIIIGAINKIRNHPRKTKYMFTIFICSNCNNFFSELCKHHTQSLLVPFLEPHFLFPLPGVDFSLHLFWGGQYSNMTVCTQIGVFLNNLSQWDPSMVHYPIQDWGWGRVGGEEESDIFPWFHSKILFNLI